MGTNGTGGLPPATARANSGVRVLSKEECLALLRSHRLGRLALSVDDQPHIFPVNYLYEETSVVIRTAPGLKLDHGPLRAVAFEIDDASPNGDWGWSVVVLGPCFDLTDTIDKRSERLLELPVRPWAPGAREHCLSVLARHVSGRAFG